MTTSTHITTSGGLISAAFIENVRGPVSRQRGTEPASFALPWAEPPSTPAALEERVATAWELLLERWDAVRADLCMSAARNTHHATRLDISQLRSRWLLPLFKLLDFDPVYLRGDTVLDEAGKLRFPLSHRGWSSDTQYATRSTAPAIHTVSPTQSLDERTGSGSGIKARSPHDILQAFLNASPGDLWAVLSNGIFLRLLRDYHHTFTKGYVQFDLESILETRNYGDFRALYRMCHASRFLPFPPGGGLPFPPGGGTEGGLLPSPPGGGIEGGLLPLEQFYKDSIATGIKVGEDLRGQVRRAIETLGNGFLSTSPDLIRRLQRDAALCRRYYSEILHVIYRVLFLLFAEQRGMMPGRNSLYAESYSIAALRARAEGDIPRRTTGEARFAYTDLWHGLQVTFRMVREGVPELGVFGYDGMLFDDDQIPLLSGSGRGVRNSDLLHAIRALTLIEREGVLQRISYADLGVEELGSIYESLLDFTPRVTAGPGEVAGREGGVPANTFFLDPRGSERKTTGSYYTHPSLVNELVGSALLPVMRDRLAAAGLPVVEDVAADVAHPSGEIAVGLLTDYAGLTGEQRAAGEAAILSVKICDPAAGSGHFLVKANNVMGAELARIRTGDEYPTEDQIHAARRDVLAHCIYGVDLNPMAVELCKVSLWINASVRDKPLSFLDHHIKCGNSLIGATPELMEAGIPTDAFKPIAGNGRAVVNAVRARNRKELKEWEAGAVQGRLFLVTLYEPGGAVHREYVAIADLAEEQPKVARERYAEYLTADEHRRRKLEADFWAAAFFWPLAEETDWAPTHSEFIRLRAEGPEALPPEAADGSHPLAQIEALAKRYRFFHWHLEFPDVFDDFPPLAGEGPGEGSGFDVVLGNPPWERIKLQEKEFFADKSPEIANARTAAARRRLIRKLPQTNPDLHAAYTAALRESEATSHFLRESGRYPLSAVGDVNTYQVFAGLVRQIVGPRGRVGIVIPSGIATDYYNRDYFRAIVEEQELVSLYDFENREGLFPGTHRSYKFSLLTLTGGEVPEAEFAFFLHTTDELADAERRFSLSREEIALINPNTGTVPVFRARRDAELTERLYRASPVLHNEEAGENPWGVSFLRMFDMTNDSHLFRTRDRLEAEGFVLAGNRFVCDEGVYLPVYEGRMIHHFDHRPVSVGITTETQFRSGVSIDTTPEQYTDSNFVSMPRYWVAEGTSRNAIPAYSRDWFIAFKDITSPTNERTLIATVIPFAAVGNSAPLLLVRGNVPAQKVTSLVGNLASFSLDSVARQKLGGVHVNFYLLQQFPVLPPDRYTPELLDFIAPRVVELTYTAWDLQPFARDVLDEVGQETWARWFEDAPIHTSPPPEWAAGAEPPPFVWNEERRARLRAELDALYAHLYGLTRDELAYILDTFPIVRRKDEERWGEYRTKRMVLEAYEGLESLTR